LFTRRAAVKTHLTRNRQLLTRGPKGVPQARGPESVTTVHSQPHRQMRRLEPSPSRLRIFPLPSSAHLLTHLLTHLLSYLSDPSPISPARPFFLVPTLDIYIRACRTLHTMNTERVKGCWRGLNLDEQLEVVLRDGLSERLDLGGARTEALSLPCKNLAFRLGAPI
jgi:hypothetical protein